MSVRDVLALDFPAQWKGALQEKVLPKYQNFSTMASLARQVLQEFILCHLSEQEAREWRILATYQSLGRPDVLLFAIRNSEELRRNVAGESGGQPHQIARPKTSRRTG